MKSRLCLALLSIFGCTRDIPELVTNESLSSVGCIDGDRDGFGTGADCAGADCDDTNANIWPGAVDAFGNSIDENCDGVDGVDADSDGVASLVSGGTDCNDLEPGVNPAQSEIYYNGVNDDCNAATRDNDADNDGIGAQVATGGSPDCDDTDPNVYPGADDQLDGASVDANCDGIDGIDNDLDGIAAVAVGGTDCDDNDPYTFPGAAPLDDATACMRDVDDDGYGDATVAIGVTAGADCADGAASRNPGAADLFGDGVDQNCDGADGVDRDGDGVASIISGGSDCDDLVAGTLPGAVDTVGDGIDQNCDGADGVDNDRDGAASIASSGLDCDDTDRFTFPGAAEFESILLCMRDADADGYGDSTPGGAFTAGTDCRDDSPAFSPAVADIFGDSQDSNCDGADGIDVDGDGVASTASGGTDCNDFDSSNFPGNTDAIDGIDNNCDGADGIDQDGDGYAGNSNDCDDTSATTHPGAAELESLTDCKSDFDLDGYGDDTVVAPVLAGTDCDDGNPQAYPGASDVVGDSVDQNCDGPDGVDLDGDTYASKASLGTDCDDLSSDTFPGSAGSDSASLCMKDSDNDGYGDDSPGTGIEPGSDCNDNSGSINAGAADTTVNSVDENCDGIDGQDADSDGFAAGTSPGQDCDDTDVNAFPGAAEAESLTACMRDADGDGWGDATASATFTSGNDCADDSASTFPGSAENESTIACMRDQDNDGFGDDGAGIIGPAFPPGATSGQDCNDTLFGQNPNAEDSIGDTIDQNCDGSDGVDFDGDGFVDANAGGTDCNDLNASAWQTATVYPDSDNDGFGEQGAATVQLCIGTSSPSGFASSDTDCNDDDPLVNTDEREWPDDGKDNDCSGSSFVANDNTGIYLDPSYGAGGDGSKDMPYDSWSDVTSDAAAGTKPVFITSNSFSDEVSFQTGTWEIYGGYTNNSGTWTRSAGAVTTFSRSNGTLARIDVDTVLSGLYFNATSGAQALIIGDNNTAGGFSVVLKEVRVDSNSSSAIRVEMTDSLSLAVYDSEIEVGANRPAITDAGIGSTTLSLIAARSRFRMDSSSGMTAGIDVRGNGTTAIITNCRFEQPGGAEVVWIDASTGVGLLFVSNNVFQLGTGMGSYGVRIFPSLGTTTNAYVYNNILVAGGTDPVGVEVYYDSFEDIAPQVRVSNNLFDSVPILMTVGDGASTQLTNISDVNNCTYQGCVSASANITGSALLNGVTLEPSSGSVAVDAGVDVRSLGGDRVTAATYDGESHSRLGNWDIGCYDN